MERKNTVNKITGQNMIFRIMTDEKPHESAIKTGYYLTKEGMVRLETKSGHSTLPSQFTAATILRFVDTHVIGSAGSNTNKIKVLIQEGGKINKPMSGELKKHGLLTDRRFIEGGLEVQRGKFKTVEASEPVNELDFGLFAIGDVLDITGTSKGKGFQGKMKRHGHGGRPASHGSSLDHRSGGSTGNFQNRSKTKPGTEAAGRMGGDKITVQNLQVLGIVEHEELGRFLIVNGSVPGPNKGLVYVRRSVKYANR